MRNLAFVETVGVLLKRHGSHGEESLDVLRVSNLQRVHEVTAARDVKIDLFTELRTPRKTNRMIRDWTKTIVLVRRAESNDLGLEGIQACRGLGEKDSPHRR